MQNRLEKNPEQVNDRQNSLCRPITQYTLPNTRYLKSFKLLFILSTLLITCTITGCATSEDKLPDNDGYQSCRINSDCSANEKCVDGACIVECREDRDCGLRQECFHGECQAMENIPCTRDGDCSSDELCIGGFCKQEIECQRSSECSNGAQCLDGQCVDLNDTVEDTMVEDTYNDTTETQPPDTTQDTEQDTAPPDTTPPQDTETSDTNETSDIPGCTPASGIYGDQCVCAEQCMSRLCVQNKLYSWSECTKPCQTRADCTDTTGPPFIDYFCTEVPHPEQGTIKICAADDTGRDCENNDPLSCTSGICIISSSPQINPVCTITCDSAADCMASYSCSRVEGAEDKVCYPIATPCSDNPDACFSAFCIFDMGYCTYLCEQHTDCPSPMICQEGILPNNQTILICGQ